MWRIEIIIDETCETEAELSCLWTTHFTARERLTILRSFKDFKRGLETLGIQ